MCVGDAVEEDGCGAVETDPADEGEDAAEEDLHDIVSGDGGGDAVGVFALARAENPGDGESGETADDVEYCGSAEVGEGWEAEERGELGEPAVAPDPVSEEGEDDGGEESAGCADGGETPAVSASADRDEGGKTSGEDAEREHERWVEAVREVGGQAGGEERLGA